MSVVLAVGALLGGSAWVVHADRAADDRARERVVAAAAAAVDHLQVPDTFTPVACDGGMVSYDRCYRAAALPQAAVATLAPTLVDAGIRGLTFVCEPSPTWQGEPQGCSANSSAVVVVATRDLNPDGTSTADLMANTSTVAIAAVGHLDD